MSTRPGEGAPGEALVEAAGQSEVLAELVESHLDLYPLPVDDVEVDAIAGRLAARMGTKPSRRRPLVAGAAALVAAAVAVVVLQEVDSVEVVTPAAAPPSELLIADPTPSPRVIQRVEVPGLVRFPSLGRSLEVASDTVVLTSEAPRSVVLLVQEGSASSDGVSVPEGHWAVLGPDEATLVFRDGVRPPLETLGIEESHVDAQLEEVRWMALPDRTLDAMDRLLEDR